MKPQNTLLSGIGTTVFTVMSALAQKHGAINLGQGFPDHDGPEDVVCAAAEALLDGRNQYPPMPGVPELRRVAPGRYTQGGGWIGLRRNGDHTVTGIAATPLLPPWLALPLVLGAAVLAWRREGK